MTDLHLPGYGFTFCTVAERGRTAAKTITRLADGELRKKEYDSVKNWFLRAMTTESRDAGRAEAARCLNGPEANASMAAILHTFAEESKVMLVIGTTAPGHNPERPCYRRWASDLVSEPNTLFAVPRAWLPIDCDDIEVPFGLGDGDRLPEAAAYIRDNKLPPEFADVECVVTATASSGLKGPSIARLRLFFLLDQVHELARLRSWGVAAQRSEMPIDPAVLQPGQPIYTARPTFINMTDPVPPEQWAFVLPGTAGRVSLVADRYDLVSMRIERAVSEAAARSGGNWRKLLDATLGGPTGFFEPLSRTLGLAAHTQEDVDDIANYVEALLAERADPGRQSRYSRRWVRSTLKRFRGKDVKIAERIEFLQRKLFRKG